MNSTYGLAADKMSGGEHKPEKAIHHITTRKAANNSHIHEHHHTHPEHHPMEEHTTQGDDGMVEHMMANMGQPNPGEAEADAGQSGIPATAAPPTGAAPSQGAMGA